MTAECRMDVVSEFCYLGDIFSAGGGCTRAIIARSRVAWGKFKGLLPVVTCKHLSLQTRGRVYNTYAYGMVLLF